LNSTWLIYRCLLLAALCIGSFYTDIRHGKVYNIFLLTIFIAYFLPQCFTLLPWLEALPSYTYITNILLCFTTAIGLYVADIWAPGDSKMFIVVVLIFPHLLYASPYESIFKALQILIWSFSFGYLFLILDNFKKSTRHKEADPLNKKPFPKMLSEYLFLKTFSPIIKSFILNFFLSAATTTILTLYIPQFYDANKSLCILSNILVCIWLNKRKAPLRIAVFIISLLVFTIRFFSYHNIVFHVRMLLPVIIALISGMITRTVSQNNYTAINTSELKPGMILSYYTLNEIKKTKLIFKNMPEATTESRKSRLSTENIDALKQWGNKTQKPILIVNILPFAPFIALGTLFEMVLGIFSL